jgi:hypothetical protein
MQRLLQLDVQAPPVIWDADFLDGPKTNESDDRYGVCEINASSTFAFPDFAEHPLTEIREQRSRTG